MTRDVRRQWFRVNGCVKIKSRWSPSVFDIPVSAVEDLLSSVKVRRDLVIDTTHDRDPINVHQNFQKKVS